MVQNKIWLTFLKSANQQIVWDNYYFFLKRLPLQITFIDPIITFFN